MAEKTRTSTRRVLEEPTRSNSPVSMRAQQLGLQALRDVGDFVQEERAAVGHFEAAHAVGLGVGERALDVAEQLAFEDALGEAAGVDGDQRARGAQRDGVQRLRDQSLAGAVFAGDEDVGVGRARRARSRRAPGAWRPIRRSAAGSARRAGRGSRPPGAGRLRSARPSSIWVSQDGGEARVVPGLLDEVARAAAHGLDGQFDAAPGGHHDHRQRGVERLDAVEQVETFLAGGGVARVVEVHQDGVEIAGFDGLR